MKQKDEDLKQIQLNNTQNKAQTEIDFVKCVAENNDLKQKIGHLQQEILT